MGLFLLKWEKFGIPLIKNRSLAGLTLRPPLISTGNLDQWVRLSPFNVTDIILTMQRPSLGMKGYPEEDFYYYVNCNFCYYVTLHKQQSKGFCFKFTELLQLKMSRNLLTEQCMLILVPEMERC